MSTSTDRPDRKQTLSRLIHFEDGLDRLMDQLGDTEGDPVDEAPVLREQDLSRLCHRFLRHEIRMPDLQRWALVVEGIEEIRKETQRLYPLLSELWTNGLSTPRAMELQSILAA